MEITRIKEPKFKVGRYSLNLTELWQLRFEVVKGLKDADIVVKDYLGNRAIIYRDGSLSNRLEGMDTSVNIKFDLLKYVNRGG